MAGFLIFGVVLTLLILAGGASLWWRMERTTQTGSGKLRHREEARHLQTQLDSDGDFAHHFHRPTQNEILETVQALDHLTPGWERDSDALTYERFKNELAESFPALCRNGCAYPRSIASDVARRFDHAALSPEAVEGSLQAHAEEQARRRAAFHAARAHANARLQMSTGPAVGPVTLAPGSLRVHVAREQPRSRRPAWIVPAAVVVLLAAGGAGAYRYLNPVAPAPSAAPTDHSLSAGPAETPGTPAPTTNPPAAATAPSAAPTNPGALGASGQPAPTVPATETAPAVGGSLSAQAPLPPPTAPPLPPAAQASLAERIAQSQLRAIDKYPALAVPNSELNLRFVFRYNNLVEDHSPRLQEPDWPEKLAEECARSIAGPKGRNSTPSPTKRR